MKKKIRVAGILALAATTALIASGCSSSGGDNGSSGKDGAKVTMSFWDNSTTGPGKAFWQKTVKDFEASHPNVTIKIQTIQNEDLDGKLQTALNSGDAPDIFLQRGGGKMAAMAAAGQLQDLTNSVDAATKKAVGDGAFKSQSIDGKLYAMPISVAPEGIYYSKDLFTRAGITAPPTTIDELNAAVTKLKAAGIAPIAVGAKDAWPAAHWYYNFALRECSKSTLDKAATTFKFDNSCWTKAGDDLKAFSDTKPFNAGFLTTPAQQGAGSSAGLVANHKAAMELMGSWDPGVIASLTPDQKPLPDLGWFPFPSINGGEGEAGAIMGSVGGDSCSVKAPKECAEFLNYATTQSVQEGYYKAFNAIPVNKAAQGVITESYLKDSIKSFNDAPYASQFLDTLYGQNVGNALNVGVVNMLAGKGSPADIIKTVDQAAAKG
ncbi:ABC transporter substrate-binding protein [Leifsonia sp. Root112D2]|uniref:ABC transporter substrate-binding protein n=1 Tax=Leifsonia sp. Root112D2 TaxID=1736426 RepID=UPI0006F4419F|nr:extracellular solute-binding protein [Leifsonia sp. Root112D2]KQV06203.1 sugar ABC transporter substrate-binding protein [Leifsonia sp. Root112D2]